MNHPLVISLLIRREQCGGKKIIEGSSGLIVHSGLTRAASMLSLFIIPN